MMVLLHLLFPFLLHLLFPFLLVVLVLFLLVVLVLLLLLTPHPLYHVHEFEVCLMTNYPLRRVVLRNMHLYLKLKARRAPLKSRGCSRATPARR